MEGDFARSVKSGSKSIEDLKWGSSYYVRVPQAALSALAKAAGSSTLQDLESASKVFISEALDFTHFSAVDIWKVERVRRVFDEYVKSRRSIILRSIIESEHTDSVHMGAQRPFDTATTGSAQNPSALTVRQSASPGQGAPTESQQPVSAPEVVSAGGQNQPVKGGSKPASV